MNLTPRHTLQLLAAFALLLSASGFVLEYGFHVLPCEMCWWQRYMHYAIAVVGLLGYLAPSKHFIKAFYFIALAAAVGLGIAMWQFAAQHGWLPFPASCTSTSMPSYAAATDLLAAMSATKVIPCDKETFTLFGLSLAAYNIPAMFLVLVLSVRALLRRP